MNRPWQIWLAFSAAAAILISAVGWLSHKALQSEAAEAAANRQARLDEVASLALWRMDSFIAPLVAQESARPYFMYNSFYSSNLVNSRANKGKTAGDYDVPSPLLTQTVPNVQLHFQCDPLKRFTCPEAPQGPLQQQAAALVPAETLSRNSIAFSNLRQTLDLQKLLAELPPPDTITTIPSAAGLQPTNGAPVDSFAAVVNSSQASPVIDETNQSVNPNQADANSVANVPISQSQTANSTVQQQAANLPNQNLAQGRPDKRGQLEFQARSKSVAENSKSLQNSGLNNFELNNDRGQPASDVQMAMMTPHWISNDLLLARRVNIDSREYVQGCLLNWSALKQQMLDDVADLLPHADLQPAPDVGETVDVRRLASLPVVLLPGALPADAADSGLSPIKQSLFIAWGAMGLAVVAVAALLRGVIALSERRAAFVSAVTHELRTPLTTFRMYAEMLSEGMVRGETDRRQYLETLRTEADRLTHLVANVLAYARLERGGPSGRMEIITVERLMEVATQRLANRAAQARLRLSLEPAEGILACGVRADPAAVEQILFNLVDNACKYALAAADRTLHLSASSENGRVRIRLRDHGAGVALGEQRRLFKPFHKSAREAAQSAPGVGLGLALSQRLAHDMQGDLQYEKTVDGACFVLSLRAVE